MDSGIRLAEIMAALSRAADLGMGQPIETALSTCIVSVRLGKAAGLSEEDLRDTYYLALLRYIGCNAETHVLAALVGDELALRGEFAAIDAGDPRQVVALVTRYLRRAEPEFVRQVMRSLPGLMHESFSGHCEVAQRLATRMGLPESLIGCLGQLYERWDGKGHPRGLTGEAVAAPVRVVTLAEGMVVLARAGDIEAALSTVRSRSGGAYDPRLSECLIGEAGPIFAGLDEQAAWSTVLDLEPGDPQRLDPRGLERCCEAIADFADLKSPHTLGHSSGVARLATGAGRRAGLLEADVTVLRHAALLHDVGRAGVSAGVWGKPGPLSDREWEQVRLHPYYTERVLAQPEPLARLGRLASQHHERLNGSGYHRAATAGSLSPAARILAAADAYQAMTEPRPHRPALAAAAAANHRSRVVGVVLSGYLDDGAEGMRDIVRSGGVGIAQDPAEAVNPEMPENAIMRAELELALPLAAIAAKIDELASGGVVVVRPEMGESRGDHLEPERPDVQIGADDSPGAPTGLTCPECHGVLWAGPDITSQVFHCRVGHSYSIETLQEEQRMAVERALWAAVRSLREQAAVAEHVAGRAEDRALEAIARRYRKRERAANENADTLERILMRDVPEDAEDLEA